MLGIQQIAIGALDKGDLSTLWEGLFGCTKVASVDTLLAHKVVDSDNSALLGGI